MTFLSSCWAVFGKRQKLAVSGICRDCLNYHPAQLSELRRAGGPGPEGWCYLHQRYVVAGETCSEFGCPPPSALARLGTAAAFVFGTLIFFGALFEWVFPLGMRLIFWIGGSPTDFNSMFPR